MLVKSKILGLTLATALMMAQPMLVWADTGAAPADAAQKDGQWQHHGHEGQMLAKILNLSDDQVKQLKDLHQKQKDALKSTFEQIKANRQAFESEIVKATPDMAKINDIQTQIKALQSQMVDNHLNSLLEIKKVLTPEQFAGYMALEKAKQMMMHKGHGKFDHHDGMGKNGDEHKHWGDDSNKDNN